MSRLPVLGMLVLLACLLTPLAAGLSVESVEITNANITTQTSLNCRFNVTGIGSLTANYTWYNGTTGMVAGSVAALNASYGTVTLDSSNTTKGEQWRCGIIVSNTTDWSSQSNSTQVTIQNSGPIITYPTTLQTAYEDQAFSLKATASDPDGDAITLWNSVDQNLSLYGGELFDISPLTGDINFTADYAEVGNHTMSLFARDSTNWGGLDVLFEVIAVNDAPYFQPALEDQIVTEGNTTWDYVIQGEDEENDIPFTFLLKSTGGVNLTLTSLNDTTAVLNFTSGAPNNTDTGNWTITLNISDSLGASIQDSFNLEVLGQNHAPILTNISNKTAVQGGNLTFFVNATDIDTNDTLTFTINDSLYNITTVDGNATGAIGLINVSVLNNSHVINRWVNISVSDGQLISSQTVFLNITNTNDAPYINNVSYAGVNSGNNFYLQNLTAYSGLLFTYQVNGTDPDLYTYEGESYNYTTNDSNFFLDNTTGLFNITPGPSLIGNWSVLVTITDDGGLNGTAIANFTVINNTAPYFNQTIQNFTCFEDIACLLKINATDNDPGDIVTFTDNTSLFTIQNTTGLVNFTPNQDQLGNYSILITINDTRGVSNSTSFLITINNTNDPPVFSPDPNATFPVMVVNHSITYDVNATDQDLLLTGSYAYDNLTFYVFNLSSPYLFNITQDGIITWTPNDSVVGTHLINITVNDTQGAQDSRVINFTVYPPSNPPVIHNVTPYGTPVSNTTVFAFYNASDFPNNITGINLSENSSILFNHTTTNEPNETMTYHWYYDNTALTTGLLEDNHTLNYSFGFFSSGMHNLTLVVWDDRYESASFTWNLSINDTNRAPQFLNPLPNLTVGTETLYSDFFAFSNGTMKFIDPDDDNNSNSLIDGNETNNLIFAATSGCNAATLTIVGTSLRVTPDNIGTCTVQFNATDGQLTINSNYVIVNVTDVPEDTEQVVQQSGGGGSSTTRITIPIPEEVEIPKAVEIIASEVIAIYNNRTMIVPFKIKNTWNDTIQGVNISAETNVSNVTLQFQKTFYSTMAADEVQENSITVTNYREGETFEIKIIANVSEPDFSDSASVFINSLEQFSEGQDVNAKISFARDLLSNNPECQELNELLGRAQDALKAGQALEASNLIEGVIQGCKYLIDQSTKIEESPKKFDSYFLFGNQYITYGAIGAVALLVFLSLLAFITRGAKQKKQGPKPSQGQQGQKPPT